jgi:hypothetical protein
MRPKLVPQWVQFRQREDLTDYVAHLTRGRDQPKGHIPALQVLLEILRSGHIRPTFAEVHGKPTIKGKFPAVCLTEMPIRYILNTLDTQKRQQRKARMTGYGIVYHKVHLYGQGGRPVWYASINELRYLKPEILYLYTEYEPKVPQAPVYPRDFTREREWRIKVPLPGLPIVLPEDNGEELMGAVIVDQDHEVIEVEKCLAELAAGGCAWASRLRERIISLETARENHNKDPRYAKVDDWPWSR